MFPTTVSAPIDADVQSAVETAKLAALYNFAYGLSHEINNPLANIATRAQTLLADEKNPERRRKLATIVQQAFRAHEMIADLMLFARPPALRKEPTDLVQLVNTVVGDLRDQAGEQGTRLIHNGLEGPLVAKVDPTQIAVALKALMQNGLEAVRTGGEVGVTAALSTQHSYSDPAEPNPKSDMQNPKSTATPHSTPRTPHFLLSVSDTGP